MATAGPDADKPSPKTATLSGIKFIRSVNGNLYRADLAKTMKLAPWPSSNLPYLRASRLNTADKLEALCPKFSTTGK
jgi:hypothetical protein